MVFCKCQTSSRYDSKKDAGYHVTDARFPPVSHSHLDDWGFVVGYYDEILCLGDSGVLYSHNGQAEIMENHSVTKCFYE